MIYDITASSDQDLYQKDLHHIPESHDSFSEHSLPWLEVFQTSNTKTLWEIPIPDPSFQWFQLGTSCLFPVKTSLTQLDTVKPILALYCKVPRPAISSGQGYISKTIKKVGRVQAKPLQNLEDLAHTVDERFVLAFTAKTPSTSLKFLPTAEETLIQLDCLLSWCCPVLKQLAEQQENVGHIVQGLANLRPRKIGDKIPQSAESRSRNFSGPGVPQPEVIGFGSIPVVMSKTGSRGNVHPESPECT
ncbi:hypothetical protein DSO57_1012874 [Entomophthora muscae]|uniref:Uncharacterized protein n=1 Tax=Entomophthora muscae TaxID=34485 RepID=A0ACC2TTL2_9FUNG|nr:hypothetical protein DSO57_1012874 [Entomophthora muscae]